MIFSATVPFFIQSLAMNYMKDPLMIDLVGDNATQLPEGITHTSIIYASMESKMRQVENYLKTNQHEKVIIFTETKNEA
jgi:superfamily II DNA/RNA helicase